MSYGIAKSANTVCCQQSESKMNIGVFDYVQLTLVCLFMQGKRKDAVLHNNNDKAKKKMKLSERTTPSANAAPSSIHKLKKLCELTKGSIYA